MFMINSLEKLDVTILYVPEKFLETILFTTKAGLAAKLNNLTFIFVCVVFD